MGKYVDPNFKKLPTKTQQKIIESNKSGQPDAGTGIGKWLHNKITGKKREETGGVNE